MDKRYNDAEGHPRDIHEMILIEPEWVARRFEFMGNKISRLKERIKDLEEVCRDAIDWIEDDRFDDPYISEEWYHGMLKLLGLDEVK